MNTMDMMLPPQSIESEQSVIGGLLIGGDAAWDRVADVVVEADFYRDDHRRIFACIRDFVERGKTVDAITIADALEQLNQHEQTGGLAYLVEIANAVPSAANIKGYAVAVAEKAKMRALMGVANEVMALALRASNMSAQDRIDEATGMLLSLSENGSMKDEPKPINEVLLRVVGEIEKRMNRGGDISGLKTGFTDVDVALDGLQSGDLVIIAGRPSMGKTAFAINIAENIATAGVPALVFSLEMGDAQLAARTLSSIGGIESHALRSGRLSDDDWDKVSAALGRLHTAPLVIDQTSSLSVSQMRARARRMKRKQGLGLVVIDYLQLMRGTGNNRNEELGDITRSLKLMARDLNCPVICLSQLSRKCEERGDKRPMLSDLRESGSIEQDADVVLMLYRDEYYNQDSAFKGLAELLIRKNRMGACGEVGLVFQPQYSRFMDAERGALEGVRRSLATTPAKSRRGWSAP